MLTSLDSKKYQKDCILMYVLTWKLALKRTCVHPCSFPRIALLLAFFHCLVHSITVHFLKANFAFAYLIYKVGFILLVFCHFTGNSSSYTLVGLSLFPKLWDDYKYFQKDLGIVVGIFSNPPRKPRPKWSKSLNH